MPRTTRPSAGLASLSGLVSLAVVLALAFVAPAATFEDMALEHGDEGLTFERSEIGGRTVYLHQRMLGEALVERDFIVYQLDPDTSELLKRIEHWTDDLPAELPELALSREDAEAMAEGEVLFSRLYMISPESDVFPLDPSPTNPCWVVRSLVDGAPVVEIFDAVTAADLGRGVPPPYGGLSITGPQYNYPCSGAWDSWSSSAANWFTTMGYATDEIIWPAEYQVRAGIQSTTVAMFYELAHGGSSSFASGCTGGSDYETTFASEIESWISNYGKMPFAFIGSCGGMCGTGDGTLSYEFRKGSTVDATTVGYCNMAETICATCWDLSIQWQNAFFNYMNQGYTVKAAHDQANADYPQCGDPQCMRFAGDETFVVVPPVAREGAPWTDATTPIIGEAFRGAGVLWLDYDGDDDLDLYVANNDGPNRLYMYVGGGVFGDMSYPPLDDAGAGTAVASADYDNDGDVDIYLVNEDGPNHLFVNNGAGGFTDGTGAGPLGDAGAGYGASWADYDRDGYVDLYIVNDGANRLLRNEGPPSWSFTDVTLPPLDDVRRGRTAAWADFDNDGDQDMYLTRVGYTSKLFRNDGGVFVDATVPAVGDSGVTIGATWGDYDNDGDLDLYLSRMWTANRLIRNDGGGAFTDVTPALLADTGSGQATAWVDVDNDGYLDLHVVNYNGPDRLFTGDGAGGFVDWSVPPLSDSGSGWGAAWADYNGDGDCDVFVTKGDGNVLYDNHLGTLNHWIILRLEGTASNRSAIGARVRVVAGGLSMIREVTSGSGNYSQNSHEVEFGLGEATVVDTIVIRWPRGMVEVATAVPADQVLDVMEGVWTTGIEGDGEAVARAVLFGNTPNPFNPVTLIQFELPVAGRVDLSVHDLSGRLVRTLVDGREMDAGRHTAPWNGRGDDGLTVASGVYFYRLEVGGDVLTKQMVLLK